MKTIIEKSKYLSLIAVIALLVTFALSLLWGVAQAVKAWGNIVLSMGQSPDIMLSILKLIDTFLVGIVLYILAASIYGLFVSDVELPAKLVAKSIPELKSKLSSVIVLVMGVYFVEVMFKEDVIGIEMVWQALAISLVAMVLIVFSNWRAKHEEEGKG